MSSSKKKGHPFHLKADFFPVTVINIANADIDKLNEHLNKTIEKAPNYFTHAPVILDVDKTDRPKSGLDIEGMCKILRDKNIIPVGIRGLKDKEQDIATTHGLALLKMQANKTVTDVEKIEAPQQTKTAPRPTTKVIDKPIRAGTQVYAKDADLVILAAVNAGAECIADGT